VTFRIAAVLACVFAIAVLVGGPGCGEPPDPPNIVLVVMDTTRADRCSLNGYDRPTTPRLVELARESTVYLDAWAPSSWTAPSHASLFTGLRPEHHGFLRGNRQYLLLESVTLAERLRDAGYRTGCFTNNNALSKTFGLVQGFQHVAPLYEDGSRPYPWAPATHRRAMEWALTQHHDGKPFFLFINDMEPHFPYTPPAETALRFYRRGTDPMTIEWGKGFTMAHMLRHNLGIQTLASERIDHISDLYDAEIRELDRAFGILLDGLRDEGILDETVFIVTSDHGENLGDHGLMDHVFSLHRSLRHVPLLVRYPPRFAAGERRSEVVRLEDVPPTILELVDLPVPEGLDGASLLGDLGGRVSRARLGPPREYLARLAEEEGLRFDPTPLLLDLWAVYDGRHHLIVYSDGREELYDVELDPGETRNLAAERTELRERLREMLPSR
jgi:arylsulfatase A-like enzyme